VRARDSSHQISLLRPLIAPPTLPDDICLAAFGIGQIIGNLPLS
jgi:hypothetical protein